MAAAACWRSMLTGHPRPQRLGLIEAAPRGARPWPCGRHPRPQRLGLIEARSSPRTAASGRSRIRGPNASASLKQGPHRRGRPRRRRIRGPNASASLKQFEERGEATRQQCIRGPNASASLKPADPVPVARRRFRIRGPNASASLKRLRPRRGRRGQPSHPRPQRLGLIEALAGGERGRHQARQASEAPTPRPH